MTTHSKSICSLFVIVMIGMFATSDTVQAKKRTRINQWEREHANATPWNGAYRHQAYSTPLAVIVPPTAATHRLLGWGVSKTSFRHCTTSSNLVHHEHVKLATDHISPCRCTPAAATKLARTIFGVLGKTLLATR